MLVPVLLFILGLLLLIKGGDWFVEGSTGIAHRFHVPEILIGATVVSIGTTLPEVMVSSASALKGVGEIAYGNAIGSVICNTALIAALSVAIRPILTDRKTLRMPVLFFFAAALVYAFSAYVLGTFGYVVAVILLSMFAVYMVISIKRAFSQEKEAPEPPEDPEAVRLQNKLRPFWLEIVMLVLGAAAIAVGADLLVDNGILIAQALHVPDSVIGLTFVALGTSLPELVTAVTSLVKGHSALSLGNIIGANFFNLVLVSGLSIALSPFDVPSSKTIFGLNSSLAVEIPVMFLVMLLLTVPALIKGKMKRWQGIVLLAVYAAFCVYQFAL